MISAEFLKDLSILEDIEIKMAIQILNDGHKRIVLVVDPKGQLIGVVADSDIRRALLAGQTLDAPVSSIMKRNPIVARSGMSKSEILKLMVESHCFEIPVVNEENKVVDLKIIQDLLSSRTEDTPATALVMAGGFGKRLLPLTEKIPKPLVEVGGQPILFRLLDNLLANGIRRIFVAISYKGEMIKEAVEAVEKYRDVVEFIEESTPLGTAGALSLLPAEIRTPVILCNADLLTQVNLSSMVRYHRTEKNSITVALREESFQIPFGVAQLEGHQILGIEEKPVQKFYVSAGMYVLDPEVIRHISKNSPLDMPELINTVCGLKERVGSFPIFEYWKDIGEESSLLQAQEDCDDMPTFSSSKKVT